MKIYSNKALQRQFSVRQQKNWKDALDTISEIHIFQMKVQKRKVTIWPNFCGSIRSEWSERFWSRIELVEWKF